MRKIVIIGGSAAGMMAAVSAAVQDSTAEVTVVTGDATAYRRPGIPALIAGYITEPSQAGIFSKQTLGRYNIKVICPAKATDIDIEKKIITVQADDGKRQLGFDSAVMATGGYPIIPKIPGADKKGVCTFTTFEDAAQIVKAAAKADSAVIVGASFIALEIAEALLHKGLQVFFNVRSRILRRLVEPDVSEFLSKRFEQSGLKILTGEAISEIGGNGSVEYVVHKGNKIPTKLVVMGAGVRPNVVLATACGIELGPTGAIKVDNRMQTSVADIYAAGDCAECPDLGTGQFVYSPVGSIGAMAGRIAGANASGGNEQTRGFLRAQADEILGLQIYSVGHSSTTAKDVNLEVAVDDLQAPLAEQKQRTVNSFDVGKLLTDKDDGIVGAQLVTRRHGSQYAWQLYQAVIAGLKKKQFLQDFDSPRSKFTEAMLQTTKSTLSVESVGEGRLKWQNTLPETK